MSLLSRAAVIRPRLARAPVTRNVHIENTVYNNMPFQYRNKRSFAVGLTIFLVGGFSIPFAAVAYQLRKSATTT